MKQLHIFPPLLLPVYVHIVQIELLLLKCCVANITHMERLLYQAQFLSPQFYKGKFVVDSYRS